jgi:hypothetical protein
MLGDFLYSLTPRDAQSLHLELRDFTGTTLTFPGGIAAQRQGAGIVIPQDRVAKVIAAGAVIQAQAGFASAISMLNLIVSKGSDFVPFAGLHYVGPTPAVGNSYWHNMMLNDGMFLSGDDVVNVFFGTTGAIGGNLLVTPMMRVLLLPRGNIGV